jgi:hypothetical protein
VTPWSEISNDKEEPVSYDLNTGQLTISWDENEFETFYIVADTIIYLDTFNDIFGHTGYYASGFSIYVINPPDYKGPKSLLKLDQISLELI